MNRLAVPIVCLSLLASFIVIVVLTDSPSNDGKAIDVVVIAGQSNAEYDEERCNVEILNADYNSEYSGHNLFFYGTSEAPPSFWDDTTWNNLSVRSLWDYGRNKWIIGGYEPVIANEISKKTNHDVLVINIAVGGRTVVELSPGNICGDYGYAIVDKALNDIRPSYDAVNCLCWIWIQGESDWYQSVDYYLSNFGKIDKKMQDFGFDKCIFVHTRTMFGGNTIVAQEQLCRENNRFITVATFTETFSLESGELLEEYDTIHYSEKGRIKIAYSIVDGITYWILFKGQ